MIHRPCAGSLCRWMAFRVHYFNTTPQLQPCTKELESLPPALQASLNRKTWHRWNWGNIAHLLLMSSWNIFFLAGEAFSRSMGANLFGRHAKSEPCTLCKSQSNHNPLPNMLLCFLLSAMCSLPNLLLFFSVSYTTCCYPFPDLVCARIKTAGATCGMCPRGWPPAPRLSIHSLTQVDRNMQSF